MKKIFTFLLVLTASVGTIFAEVVIDGIAYYLNDETFTAEVTSGGAYTGEVVIPSSITYNQQVYSVTSIGYFAFQYCTGLTSVTIGNSVTSIELDAFYGCTGLTSVTIPNSVTSIGDGAFHGCSGLTSMTIPNSVTSIGSSAFRDCTGLTSVTIPNSVTSIGNYAFSYCSGLTSIEIPNSVTSIGYGAFKSCSGLTSITIGNSVTSIADYTFEGCTGLTSVTIPNSVTSIGVDAFRGCSGLTSVTIPNSVTGIEYFAFRYCAGLTSVTIPNSVTSIGYGAFCNCTGLTSVTIPNSVTSIENEAFSNVPNIVYSGEATGSPWGARSRNGYVDGWLVYSDNTKTNLLACSSAATGTIEIPNSVTSIGVDAFRGCSGLTSVTIPNSVTSIEYFAFRDCTGLTSITCEATTPPSCKGDAFNGVDKSIPLYVLAESVDLYKAAEEWKDFKNILPISAEETETTEVQTTPTENTVEVTWPAVDGAYTYELVIKDKNGNTICTLIFDAEGRLKSIAFSAPAHGDAPQKAQTAGFSFTVIGLDAGKEYNLTITAKNEDGQELDKKNVSFHTNWPQGIEDVTNDKSQMTNKVIKDGQIYILRGEHVYDAQGRMVK